MIFSFLSSAKSTLFSPIKHFIHDDFYDIVQRMPLFDRILFMIIHGIDKIGIPWHRLPVFLGLIYLAIRRYIHDEYNLFNVGRTPVGVRFNPVDFPYRTADGKFNDPFNEGAGSEGTFFGRNMSPVDQKDKLLKPDPMVVATKLMGRRKLIDTGKQFNMIAASWIQFMIHDWIDHLEETQQIELTAPREVAGECPLKSFKFYKTKVVDTGFHDIKKGHLNTRTPWWDGSAIYGSDLSKLQKLRTFKDGKLKIGKDGLLQHDNDGVPLSGDVRNGWIGLSTLQALFILEHNKICDTLKKEYQDLGDEDLYRHARLVTSAVIAKIHTIDWTVELLKTDMLHVAMRANWYGLLGKKFKDTFGHVGGAILGGLVGLKKPNNHGVPYSLTEEFVSVYRMHSLLPDELLIRDINSAPGPNKSLKVAKQIDMINLIGWRGEKELSKIGFTRQMVSMGHQASGALELWNYPLWLRDVVPQNVDGIDRPDHVDLPSLEIYRDRERNVARYNEFRRSLFLIPISKWEDLTDDQEAIETLREVYNDNVEQLDLLVGMAAEKKIKGFAISETAFVIFIIMASRRLEADRFFTSDFNEEVYTKKGLEWVNTTESLKDVLDRHYPEMTNRWMNSIVHGIDRSRMQWHRLPVFLGLMYLAARRHLHYHYSLLFVGKTPADVGFNPVDFPYRTPDGKFNDPSDEVAGSSESFFGRNMLPLVDKKKLLTPNPMVVATKLLARKQFIDTGKQLNLIAASWIQFMIHEWIDHLESSQEMELKASEEIANQCPLQSFKFYKTKKVKTGLDNINKGHLNIRTSWWDGSAIYGSNSSQLQQVRTYEEGKLKIANDGLLHHDENGLPITGDIRNGWIGVSTLQALFILEHNAVCDTLKKEYPHMNDENIFRHARLVTSAVIAKIHTIDWTVQLLKTDTLHAGMRANWYGLFGKKFKDRYGHVGGPFYSGLVGLKKPNNYGVPYSLTEEFACVYRMHSLVPDQLLIRDINSPPGPNKSPMLRNNVDMVNLIGKRGEKELSDIGFTTQMVSMGHQACGALELWNYPVWLRDVVPQNVDGTDRSNNVDLASLEIYRDRERKVPRYNRFRRSLFLIPISKWDDLTDNKEAVNTLQEVYGDDVEQLDLLVGMLAEKKIKGFGISETAFVIFLLMASRRLEADRFFTSDYKEEVYTEKGMEWVNTTESLKDVLDRHYPQMTEQWMNSTSAFTVWDAPPDPSNPIPIYLRFPR